MPVSSRLYSCCRCHAQVIICSRCDRGQRYCAGACRHEARAESTKRATQKYQSTRAGRCKNADRQQRFRQRHKQKVTHQGSAPKRLHDLLKTRLTAIKKRQQSLFSSGAVHCHYCGGVCEPLLRHDFLHSSRFKPVLSNNHQPETS